MTAKRIHRWDAGVVLKALAIGAVIEAVAAAPAALSPWGHAGPESMLGWLSVLLNMPGLFVLGLLRDLRAGNESFAGLFAVVFVVQTIIISYLVFVYLRRRKLRAEAGSPFTSFRPNAEIEASFRRVEEALDAAVEESRAHFEREGVGLRDDSNRSGFDGSGFPYFTWAYHFEKREAYGSEVKSAAARLSYREPLYEGEAQRIDVTTVAQIFQIGKQSRVGETEKATYTIERFQSVGLGRVVTECLAAAERVLAKD